MLKYIINWGVVVLLILATLYASHKVIEYSEHKRQQVYQEMLIKTLENTCFAVVKNKADTLGLWMVYDKGDGKVKEIKGCE